METARGILSEVEVLSKCRPELVDGRHLAFISQEHGGDNLHGVC